MKSLKVLQGLFANLSAFERKLLRKNLTTVNGSETVLSRFYRLLEKYPVDGAAFYSGKLYAGSSGSMDEAELHRFRKLIDRFTGRVEDVIVHDRILVEDSELYSDFYKKKFEVRKGLLLFMVVCNKVRHHAYLLDLLNKLLVICDDFELYLERALVLQHLSDLYLYESQNPKEYARCSKEIRNSFFLLESFNQARRLEHKFIGNVQHKSIDDVSQIAELEAAVNEASRLFELTKSFNILLIHLLLKLQWLHYNFDFYTSEEVAFAYLKIVQNNRSVRLNTNLSAAYMNIAYTQFYLNKFSEAMQYCRLAEKQGKQMEYNQNINREPQVFALLYLKDYRGALDLVNIMLASGIDGNGLYLMGRRKVLRCYALFLLGEYRQAWVHLQDTREAESDREGWNIGIRLLHILIALSTSKIDLADQRIAAMRKHIERTLRMRAMRKRDIVIFRILSHLSRSGFDFRDTWEERQKDFQQLKSDARELRWLPRSHEMVIFDQWFEARMLGKSYDPVFPLPANQAVV